MQTLTSEGQRIVNEAAQRHGFSFDAVATLLAAVAAGQGSQAQFNHAEFGGMGQWSQGGMIMIGDMFNDHLKGRIANLCDDLSRSLSQTMLYEAPPSYQSQQQSQGGMGGGAFQSQGSGGAPGHGSSLFVPAPGSGPWWPEALGQPGSTGAQNNLRYAVFPGARRLAIDNAGDVTVYDLGDHIVSGFSQQQSGDQSITLTSQFGTVRISDLPVVHPTGAMTDAPAPADAPTEAAAPAGDPGIETAPQTRAEPTPAAPEQPAATESAGQPGDLAARSFDPETIIAAIERLDELRKKSILTDAEFEAKKTELLGRL